MTLPLCWVCIVESCYGMTALDYSRSRNETNRNCTPIGTVMAKGQMFLPNNFMISGSTKGNSWERRSFRVLRAQSRYKEHTCFDSFNDIGENWILKINFLRIKQGKDATKIFTVFSHDTQLFGNNLRPWRQIWLQKILQLSVQYRSIFHQYCSESVNIISRRLIKEAFLPSSSFSINYMAPFLAGYFFLFANNTFSLGWGAAVQLQRNSSNAVSCIASFSFCSIQILLIS